MGIENLVSTVVQSTPGCGIPDVQSASTNPLGSDGGAAFMEQLAEQMDGFTAAEPAALILVHELNADMFAAASGLPNGNLLPPPAVPYPQSLVSANAITSSFSDPPTPFSYRPGTARGAGDTIPQVTPDSAGALIQKEVIASGAGDLAGNEGVSEGPGRIENSALHGFEETLADIPAPVARGESLNTQISVRHPSELEKAPVLTLERSVSTSEWKEDLADRILWMTRNSMTAAELKVNPPQMGPVDVRINLQHDQMNVIFASQNAAVREAIEAAIPRLREMLGGQQLNLMNAEVSHSFADQHQNPPSGKGDDRFHGQPFLDAFFITEQSGLDDIESGIRLKHQGLLNYYV